MLATICIMAWFRLGIAVIGVGLITAPSGKAQSSAPPSSGLDFEEYRTVIEPIFLKKRENGAMCYTCHSVNATRLHLQRLDPGSASWTEEQSRKNFESVSKLITPGDPLKSRLLVHPSRPMPEA